eukprot:gene33959-43869_t
MRGVCSRSTAELRFHAIFPTGGPPVLDNGVYFSDILRVLNNCGMDHVSMVNISIPFCLKFKSDEFENVRSMVSHIDLFQIDQPPESDNNTIEIDIFSSEATMIPEQVTIVGASDVFGHLASFSNYGNMVSLMAPGEKVLSTSTSLYGYEVRDGTSQSAPFVTGAMALMKTRFRSLSYYEIVERLQNTADLHFSLRGKSISGGRLNIGRALGLTESLISEEERVSAYPLRDQAFVAYSETFFEIIDAMTITDFFTWYNSDHGRRFECELSCMLLVQAIDHLRAVDASEFPMLLNVEQRAALLEELEELRTPINDPVPACLSLLQSKRLADCLEELGNSLVVNPPDLLPPNDRQRATCREWETVFRLTRGGEIRTAFLRHWAYQYRSREPYAILSRALEESKNAVAVLEQYLPEGASFLSLWRNEKKWLGQLFESDYVPTPDKEAIEQFRQIDPPEWVQTPTIFFAGAIVNPSPPDSFVKVEEKQTLSLSIEVWEDPKSRRSVRLEYDSDMKLLQAISANFIFITFTDSPFSNVEQLRETIQQDMNSLFGQASEGEVWLEQCPTFKGFCALHISSKKIEFYDSILQKYDFFPRKMRMSNPQNPFDTVDLPVNIPPTPLRRIKVGVIDKSFVHHTNLPGSEQMPESPDSNHGTHVAGIIAATTPADGSVAMKGLCSPTSVELHLYVLFSTGGPPLPENAHFFRDLVRVFNNCGMDHVSLINLSMEWCNKFNSGQEAFLRNMLSHIVRLIRHWRCHVVIAAGNHSRNLDLFQIGQPPNRESNTIEIDIFSSLATMIPEQVTIVGVSDVFGHLASFSNYNYGSMVSLMALGEHILSTSASPDGYDVRSGTSQSTPFVTGAMALMKARFPELTYSQIVERLQNTVDLHFSLRGKSISGGRLNIGRALGLTGSLISEEERVSAYPLRDQAFVSYYEPFINIIDTMTITDFFAWYESDHGR